jgi:hypothetical protein
MSYGSVDSWPYVAFPAWMGYMMIVRVVAAARRKKR